MLAGLYLGVEGFFLRQQFLEFGGRVGSALTESIKTAGCVVGQAVGEVRGVCSGEEAGAVEETQGIFQETKMRRMTCINLLILMVIEVGYNDRQGNVKVMLLFGIGDMATEEIEGIMSGLEEGYFFVFTGSHREHFGQITTYFFHFFVHFSPLALPHPGGFGKPLRHPPTGIVGSHYLIVFLIRKHLNRIL